MALLHALREMADAERFDVAGAAHLEPSASRRRGRRRRGVLPEPRGRAWTCRSTSSASTSRRLAREAGVLDRARGAHRASRVLRPRGCAARRDSCRRRAYEGRSGRNVSAAPAPRRRSARSQRHASRARASSCGRSSRRLAADVRAFLRRRRHRSSARTRRTPTCRIPRNRIRHELLPLLDARFSPGHRGRPRSRAAAIAREDAEYLEEAARGVAARLVSCTPRGVEIDADALSAEPPAVARRVIRRRAAAGGGRGAFHGIRRRRSRRSLRGV